MTGSLHTHTDTLQEKRSGKGSGWGKRKSTGRCLQPSYESTCVTWFVLYMPRQKLLEGVEDASVGYNNRGVNFNLFLSFKHCHPWHTNAHVSSQGIIQQCLVERQHLDVRAHVEGTFSTALCVGCFLRIYWPVPQMGLVAGNMDDLKESLEWLHRGAGHDWTCGYGKLGLIFKFLFFLSDIQGGSTNGINQQYIYVHYLHNHL